MDKKYIIILDFEPCFFLTIFYEHFPRHPEYGSHILKSSWLKWSDRFYRSVNFHSRNREWLDWIEKRWHKRHHWKTALIDEEFLSWLSYRIYCISWTRSTIEIRSPFFYWANFICVWKPINCEFSLFLCGLFWNLANQKYWYRFPRCYILDLGK